MGQAANGGLEANGLPRGYQPGDMPPTPQQKGPGSIRMYDDDGTWSRQTAKPNHPGPLASSAPKGDGPEQLLGRKPLTSCHSDYGQSERDGMGLSDFRGTGCDGSYAGSRDGGDVGWSTRPPTEVGGRSVAPRLDSFASSVTGDLRQGPPSSVQGYSSQYQQLPHFQTPPPTAPGQTYAAQMARERAERGAGSGAGSNPSSSMPPSPSPSTVGGYGGGFYRDLGQRADSFAGESVCGGASVTGCHLSLRPNHLGYTTAVADRHAPKEVSHEWEAGSIVEIFSASAGQWYPAQVTQVQDDAEDKEHEVLTMQFFVGDEAKQKSLYRSDSQLAPLGSHTKGQLPPGFSVKASQSRPGQSVFLDETTGIKYSSPDLAWQVHFERLMQRPAAGCETVSAIPGRSLLHSPPSPGAGSVAMGGAVRQDAGAIAVGTMPGFPASSAEPNNLISIAEDDYEALPPSDSIVHDLTTSGKIALPAFGDAMGSQAAYLTFEQKMGADEAAARSQARMLAPTTATYPSISGSAPRKPPPPPRNPQLQTWQEDPFSEWRR